MKIAALTSKKRFDTYNDPAMIPAGTELMFLPTDYTEDEAVEKLREAEIVLVDAVLPVTGRMIEAMPKLKFIQSEGVGYDRIDTMFDIGPWTFTMGSALFDKNFVAEGSFRENLRAVADYMAKK